LYGALLKKASHHLLQVGRLYSADQTNAKGNDRIITSVRILSRAKLKFCLH